MQSQSSARVNHITPGIEISYFPPETEFSGNTVLIFGRQLRTELINQLIGSKPAHRITELVESLLKFITEPIAVLDGVLTKQSMKRNATVLSTLVNTKTVFIGKPDVCQFPDAVADKFSHIFIDNSYNSDERKFIYEHYLKSIIPAYDKFNKTVCMLDNNEYLVIALKSTTDVPLSDRIHIYDINRVKKMISNPDMSEYVITPDVTSVPTSTEEIQPAPSESVTETNTTSDTNQEPSVSREKPVTNPEPQGWISYLASFIW